MNKSAIRFLVFIGLLIALSVCVGSLPKPYPRVWFNILPTFMILGWAGLGFYELKKTGSYITRRRGQAKPWPGRQGRIYLMQELVFLVVCWMVIIYLIYFDH